MSSLGLSSSAAVRRLRSANTAGRTDRADKNEVSFEVMSALTPLAIAA